MKESDQNQSQIRDHRSQITDHRSQITDRHIHFKATLSFRGSTSSTRHIVTTGLLTNKVISTEQMYLNMSDFGKYVESRK